MCLCYHWYRVLRELEELSHPNSECLFRARDRSHRFDIKLAFVATGAAEPDDGQVLEEQ
jgi:hypothetical protein